jgi:UTP--glucose-1-phosphate uridylyltransferase
MRNARWGDHPPGARIKPRLGPLPALSASYPLSPASLSPATRTAGFKFRLSVCEPIREEAPPGSVEVEHEVYQRHHRPRAPLQRTQSAPQLISTTTTKPIHIHHLP